MLSVIAAAVNRWHSTIAMRTFLLVKSFIPDLVPSL